MIKYLGVESFGVWATMLGLITWLTLFDFGIGNGLKNKLAESLALGDALQGRSYISTAYALVGVCSLVLWSVFIVVDLWIDWQSIFNTHVITNEEFRVALGWLSFFILFNFWLGLIQQVAYGLQKASWVVFGQFITNLLSLICVYILYLSFDASLLYLIFAYGLSLTISNLLMTGYVWFKYALLRPTLGAFEKGFIKSLLSLGVKFFVIQLAMIFIFMVDKLIITQLMGPQFVTPYEVLFKLFGIFTMLFSLITAALWTAYSDAYARGDYNWLKTTLSKQLKTVLLFSVAAMFLAAIGPWVVQLWIGQTFDLQHSVYFWFAAMVIINIWTATYAVIANATGILNVQVATAVIAAIINVPLSYWFIEKLGYGMEGVVIATIISLSLYAVFGPVQVHRVLNGKTA